MNFFERLGQPQNKFASIGNRQGYGTIYNDPNANAEGPWVNDGYNYGTGFEAPQPGPGPGDYYAPEIAPQPQYEAAPQMNSDPAQEPFDWGDDADYEPQPQPEAQPQYVQQPPQRTGRGIVEEDTEVATPGGVRGSGDPRMATASDDHIAYAAQVQQRLGQMLNGGASDQDIRAWVAEQGLNAEGLEEALAYRRANPNAQTPVFAKPVGEALPEQAPPPEIGTADALGAGIRDGFSFGFADEMGGGGDAVKYLFGQAEGDSFTDAYTRGRDARRLEHRSAQYHKPGTLMAGQLLGGALTMPVTGGLGGALRGGQIARGIQGGAVAGGIYGVGSAEGDIADHAKGALLGGTLGAVTGGAVSTVGAGINRGYRTPRGQEVIDAASRVNQSRGVRDTYINPDPRAIRPSLAHTGNYAIDGAGSLRGRLSAAVRETIPGYPLRRALTTYDNNVGEAVGDLATRTGARTDDMVDMAVQQTRNVPGSMGGYRDVSRGIANGMYNQADNLGGGALITPTRTVQALDDMIGRFARTPGTQDARAALTALRDEMASQQWTTQGLRDLRTSYGRRLNSTDGVTRLDSSSMWAELSRDITNGLQRSGRGDAARAYRQADRYYARRAQTNRVLDDIIGPRNAPKSPEIVADNIAKMARREPDRLQSVLRQLPSREADDVRGNIIRHLGMAAPSRAGDRPTFSIATFSTEWNRLSTNAKNAMFGAQTVRDLDDLGTLATAARSLPQNGSNSANIGLVISSFLGAMGVAYDMMDGNVSNSTVGLGAGLTFTGLLLGNRRITRGLINYARTGRSAPMVRTINETLRRTRDNPAWQQELTGMRDLIVGHDGNARVVIREGEEATEAAPTDSGASLFDSEGGNTGTGSIFDGEDDTGDVSYESAFSTPLSEVEETVEPDGRTAEEIVAEGEGEEPIY